MVLTTLAKSTKKKKEENPFVSVPSPFTPLPQSKPEDFPKEDKSKGTGKIETFLGPAGTPSGITLPDGRTFFGVNAGDVDKIIAGEQRKAGYKGEVLPVSTVQQARQQEDLQKQAFLLAQQTGQPIEEIAKLPQFTGVDWKQALGSGVTATLPGIAGGVAVGGTGGAYAGGIGAVPGAIIGGIVGAVGGFVGGIISNLKAQRGGEISAVSQSLKTRTTNLRALVTATNQDPGSAADNLMLFNEQLALLDRDHGKLKLETQSNLNKFLGRDGTPELARYDVFNSPGGTREYLVAQMQQAILNPDPNKSAITLSDVAEQE